MEFKRNKGKASQKTRQKKIHFTVCVNNNKPKHNIQQTQTQYTTNTNTTHATNTNTHHTTYTKHNKTHPLTHKLLMVKLFKYCQLISLSIYQINHFLIKIQPPAPPKLFPILL